MPDISAAALSLAGEESRNFFVVFCRVASALGSAPAFGETYIPLRSRMALAVLVAALLAPGAKHFLPPLPGEGLYFALTAAGECVCGLLLGTCVRVFCSAMHTVGMIFASQAGLSAAVMFDPSQSASGSVSGVFLSLAATAMIFASGLDLMYLEAVADSYALVPAGVFPTGDYAEAVLECAERGFSVAVRLSMPFLAAGCLFQILSGVTSRMAPQMQVFFALAPLQLLASFAALGLVLSSLVLRFGEELEALLAGLSG